MKQLLPLFLFLLPCFALAQYPSNGNQKITLGEQTTADGLIYRGVLGDTALITPSRDTSAYIILDTVNHRFYNYNRATNVWSVAGEGTSVTSFSAGTTGLTPNTATSGAVTLAGTLAVANGGTNRTTMPAGYILHGDGTSVDTSINLFFNRTSMNLGIGTNNPTSRLQLNDAGAATILLSGGLRSDVTLVDAGAGENLKRIFFRSIDGKLIFGSENDAINSASNKVIILAGFAASGNMGIGIDPPTARLHIAAGTATASTAPLKFTSGTNLTTAEAGAMEFNGTNLFFSPSTTRHTVNHGLTGSATLDFPSTTTLLSADLTITVTGAADGDVVSLGVPNAAVNANTSYSAWVSAANTVTVRFNNYSSGTVNPASGSFKVFVTK
jgi:hypothetical protein